MIIRYTRCDKEFIENMPPKLLAELIILDDVIPDDLQSALIRNNKIFNKELFKDLIDNDLMDRKIKINEDLLMNYYLFKEAKASVFEDVCPYHYISTANSASKTQFTTDPLSVLKIIYSDITPELKDIIFSRICISYISYSTMTYY